MNDSFQSFMGSRLVITPQSRSDLNQITINDYFDRIYLINLKRRPDRLIKILQKLRSLRISVQVVNAVDGNQPENLQNYRKYLKQPIDPNSSHPLELKRGIKIIKSPGAWGYLLTWRKILMDAKNQGYHSFLSLDDDVIFIMDFQQKFLSWIKSIPETWKVLQLGATQLPHLRGKIIKKTQCCQFYHPHLTDGSFATAVMACVYDDLLTEIDKMNAPVDSGPLRAIYQRYPNSCFVAYPHLIIADVEDSDIRRNKKLPLIATKLGWDLKLYDVKPTINKVSLGIWIKDFKLEKHKHNFRAFMDKILSPDLLEVILITTNNLQLRLRPALSVKILSCTQNLCYKTAEQLAKRNSTGKYFIFIELENPVSPELLINLIEVELVRVLLYNIHFSWQY